MPDNKLVATTLAIPDVPPLQGINHYEGPLWWTISAVGAVLAGFFWFRRKVSYDNKEIAKDGAESSIIKTLIEERDKAMKDAREAWARRTFDAQRIASLEMENGFLKRDIASLTAQVGELKRTVDLVMNAITSMRPDFKLHAAPPSINLDPA